MSKNRPYQPSRRMRADEIRDGDPYELSESHVIWCEPTGGRGSDAVATGAAVLKSDPQVESAGVDTGFSPAPDTLRAPDVAVGNVPREPGWVKGVPPLAVEYADTGQDEADLAVKIRELLSAGTQRVWVVRLSGPRRVEIHQDGQELALAHSGDDLQAPGILQNPVPVDALYDWEVGREVTLRNLLQRHGFESLAAVQAEGEATGRTEGEIETLRTAVFEVLAARGLDAGDEERAVVASCHDASMLRRWLRRAATVSSAAAILVE